jgi:hypothetical protein
MPLDPGIPLQSGKGQPDPLETAARIFTIKAASQQAQLGDYKLKDQMTLRDVSALPSVKDEKGNVNYQALLQEGLNRGIGPDTVMTLNAAAQKQQEFKQSQQKFKTDQMTSFIKQSADPMAAIYTEFQQDSTKVGPEKAWEIAQPKTEALRQQLTQTFPDMKLQPMQSPDQLHAAAMHSATLIKNLSRANQPSTPHEKAMENIGERRVKATEDKNAAGMTGKGALSEDALNMAADQYLAGDSTAAQGYARNAQMKSQLTNAIAARAKAKGMSGEDVAAKVAEFQGIKAGERSAGTRTAQVGMAVAEAQRMIPLALDASEKASRLGIKSLNDIQQAVQKGTASPELRKFVAANNSLVNVYSRAVSPTGTPTVSDKDHAREVLSTGFSKGDYKAAVEQLQAEMQAAQASPGDVRKEFRQAVTGKDKTETKAKRKVYNPATGKIEEQ